MTRIIPFGIALVALAGPAVGSSEAAAQSAADAHHPNCDAPAFHQFDFWPGEWEVDSRLRQPDGSWRETTQKWSAEKRVQGCILVDYAQGDFGPTPMSGMGTRYYDPQAEHWVITWISTQAPGQMGRWVGGFEDGVGDFLSEGDGPVRSRIRWTDIQEDSVHWEYAVSQDGGESWTTQWTMDFRRAASESGER